VVFEFAPKEGTGMYSPKIPERFIPALYKLARTQGRPMTQLVAEAVQLYLASEGLLVERRDENVQEQSCDEPRIAA
jgi:hypothetical protein